MNTLIPAIVCSKGSSWYCAQHNKVLYTGDALNTAKILSDNNCSEIAIMNLDDQVHEYILDIPKHITRPVSISGGINNIDDARKIIRAGFDRIGLTYPFVNNTNLPHEIINELGESTLCINIRPNHSNEIPGLIDKIRHNYSASEYIIHDINLAGSLNGLSQEFIDIISALDDDNYALSGGYAGEEINHNFRVYYSTKYMFPISKTSKIGGIGANETDGFIVCPVIEK